SDGQGDDQYRRGRGSRRADRGPRRGADRIYRRSRGGGRRVPGEALAHVRRPLGVLSMTVKTPITLDAKKLNAALARLPRDRRMQIGGREVRGAGETIEGRSPAHGVVVTRVPRGRAEDARAAIAAARSAFDKGPWPSETASSRALVLLKVADLIDRDREALAL